MGVAFCPPIMLYAYYYLVVNVTTTNTQHLTLDHWAGKMPRPPSASLLVLSFRKPTSPPLPLREGPPLISVFFNSLYDPFGSPCRGQKPQGRRGNRSCSSLGTIAF